MRTPMTYTIDLEQEVTDARRDASRYYRRSRKFEREIVHLEAQIELNAENAAWFAKREDEFPDYAASLLRLNETLRKSIEQNKRLAPKYREFGRAAAERKRSYEVMIAKRRQTWATSTA